MKPVTVSLYFIWPAINVLLMNVNKIMITPLSYKVVLSHGVANSSNNRENTANTSIYSAREFTNEFQRYHG